MKDRSRRWAQSPSGGRPHLLTCRPSRPLALSPFCLPNHPSNLRLPHSQDASSLGLLAEKLEGDKAVLEGQLAEAREAQVRRRRRRRGGCGDHAPGAGRSTPRRSRAFSHPRSAPICAPLLQAELCLGAQQYIAAESAIKSIHASEGEELSSHLAQVRTAACLLHLAALAALCCPPPAALARACAAPPLDPQPLDPLRMFAPPLPGVPTGGPASRGGREGGRPRPAGLRGATPGGAAGRFGCGLGMLCRGWVDGEGRGLPGHQQPAWR